VKQKSTALNFRAVLFIKSNKFGKELIVKEV